MNSINKNAFPKIKIITINNNDYDILCHLTDGVSDFLSESLIQTYIQNENPAPLLVEKSVNGEPIHSDYLDSDFRNIIYPGQDNATAIVYTKKKIKNN
jgi:serine/threonine protein phosphatase PrpC